MMNEHQIPVGECQCGCGLRTGLARKNDPRRGHLKGQPVKFVSGHKLCRPEAIGHSAGYRQVPAPFGHPKALKGRILEHVAIVERVLGHYMPDGVVIHHVNGVRSENRNDNLCVLQNQQEHNALHVRQRVRDAGGNPFTQRLCWSCRQPKDFDQFYRMKDRGPSGMCKDCARNRVRVPRRAGG